MIRFALFALFLIGHLTIAGCRKQSSDSTETNAGAGISKVKLGLDWKPEPEFGGIYAARQTGAFARHGLDVDVVPYGGGAPTWQLIDKGDIPFAVASADEVIVARTKSGADVVAIFGTYQRSPRGLMTHASRGLKGIADVFQSGTLAVEPGAHYMTFLKNKYGTEKIKLVAYDYSVTSFLHDSMMTQQCFITSEPLAARKLGGDPQVFLVADEGYNPYMAIVITQGAYAKSHPREVKAMVDSLREGWRAYLDDPAAANEVMGNLNKSLDAQTFAEAAAAQKPLIETDETRASHLGTMSQQRWETLGRQLADLKVIPTPPGPRECYLDTDSSAGK
jgi:NitT/TauT family transport system substrate-binding protein